VDSAGQTESLALCGCQLLYIPQAGCPGRSCRSVFLYNNLNSMTSLRKTLNTRRGLSVLLIVQLFILLCKHWWDELSAIVFILNEFDAACVVWTFPQLSLQSNPEKKSPTRSHLINIIFGAGLAPWFFKY